MKHLSMTICWRRILIDVSVKTVGNRVSSYFSYFSNGVILSQIHGSQYVARLKRLIKKYNTANILKKGRLFVIYLHECENDN